MGLNFIFACPLTVKTPTSRFTFWDRRAEFTISLLNLLDEREQRNPVNNFGELPRERTLLVRCQFNF